MSDVDRADLPIWYLDITPNELFSLADGLERVSRMYEAHDPTGMLWCAERLRREAEVLLQEVC